MMSKNFGSESSNGITNELSERLKQMIGLSPNTLQSQSLENLSPVRRKSLIIFQKLDSLSGKYVQKTWLKEIVMKFVRPHITDIISNKIPEDELKTVIKECFDLLKEDFEHVEIAKELNNDLNKEYNENLKEHMPNYKELAELL